MITKTILVHSSDGIAFRVTVGAANEGQLVFATAIERRSAANYTAERLQAHGDYTRVGWGNVVTFVGPLCAMLCMMLGACAAMPDSIRADVGHESHATQHKPFSANPTNYGRGVMAGVTVRWQRGPWSMDVSESYSMHGNDGSPAPREVFEAKVGYDLWTRAK